MTVVNEAASAIVDDPSRVVPVFQPVIDLATGDVIGFEALARWPEHPEVNPLQAFDAARRAGQLGSMDWWCRRRAVEVAHSEGIDQSHTLFINVEPDSLSCPPPWASADNPWQDLIDADMQIVLELTERSLLFDPPTVLHTVASARRNGFGIALDDVGARPASIALLDLIAPDVVKFDRSITQMEECRRDAALTIGAAVTYARRYGATLLAEGIELADHVAAADLIGATLGQGYLYGRPGPLGTRMIPPSPAGLVDPRRARTVPLRTILDELHTTTTDLADIEQAFTRYEELAGHEPTPGCVLAALAGPRHVSAELGARYREIAERQMLVGMIGRGLGPRPIPGVRGPRTPTELTDGVFAAASIGGDHASAIIASACEGTDRYRWCVTTDRSIVADICRSIATDLAGGQV
ncbi:EAL domain-containing protein [Williamsia sp. CHRR-6]|uniref:EAL domain-containing protein n=1 Tax=Williamsia sp. CHRR-6 TaxID=2835871 RepID=UPI001BDA9FEE|nr:EAL domain-containing protein [Williamsia sp. CHRR-6]MBT0567350.1 EAL domain-containing protein [Williamsia sp. CHRR-6]